MNPCTFHIVFRQFDFDHYSCLVERKKVEITPGVPGMIDFAGGSWKYGLEEEPIWNTPEGRQLVLKVELTQGTATRCNVSLECVFGNWLVNNYVLMPGAVYNGNRFESRRIAYSPKLLDPRDIGPEKPPIVSDIPRLNIHNGPSEIHDRSGAMTIPSMGFYAPHQKMGIWMLTTQKSHQGDFGCSITENRNRTQATFSISAPVVREKIKYRITDHQFPSDDRAPDWKSGTEIEIPIQLFAFDCKDVHGLFKRWTEIRNHLIPRPEALITTPFSSTFPIQEKKFNNQNWVEEHGYYSVGMREMFLQDWQLGWTGGMITTYPLLFSGSEETRERVIRNFDFLFPGGISPSGFFYDCGETKDDGFHWYGGDIRKPHTANWHLIRKSGDGLYYIIKQFRLMEKIGITVKPAWKEGIKTVADAFVKLWKRYGQTGQFADSITGEIVVGGSTSAGIAPAGLVFAGRYFNDSTCQDVATEMADYFYDNYVRKGLTMGGVGDALQNPDSESAYGLLESFAVLFEQIGDRLWLNRAEEMASLFSTWVVGYNYEFPPQSTLGRLGIKTLGAVYANTQNKHAAPGICTYSGVALLRLFRATGKIHYLEVLRDIARFIPQMLSTEKHPIPGLQTGWMSERVSTTDWFEGIGELMTGSTWAETSLMLTGIEVPAVYIDPARELVFTFDSLLVSETEWGNNRLSISLENPSSEIVKARIFCQNPSESHQPLHENFLYNAMVVELMPHQKKTVLIPY